MWPALCAPAEICPRPPRLTLADPVLCLCPVPPFPAPGVPAPSPQMCGQVVCPACGAEVVQGPAGPVAACAACAAAATAPSRLPDWAAEHKMLEEGEGEGEPGGARALPPIVRLDGDAYELLPRRRPASSAMSMGFFRRVSDGALFIGKSDNMTDDLDNTLRCALR